MTQILSILDSYAYRCWVWDIYVPRRERDPSDEARIAAALPRAETVLDAIVAIAALEGPFFLGDRPSLTDLHAAPMVDLLRRAPEGNALFEAQPRWLAWWRAVEALESFRETGDG